MDRTGREPVVRLRDASVLVGVVLCTETVLDSANG